MRSKLFLAILIPYLINTAHSQSTQQEPQTRTQDLAKMYYNDTLPAKRELKAVTERRVGLKYRILLKTPDCDIRDVDSSHKFQTGDGIRLWFESNVDGFLYVLNKQSSGGEKLLFPHPKINNGTNNIERGISYPVPVTDWFIFNDVPGEERITAIVSKTPLKAVPQLATAQDQKPVSILSVLEELSRRVRPNDLVLFQEKAPVSRLTPQPIPDAATQSTIVVNTSQNNNTAAYTEIRLRHQ
jgi:Domain of unknown function (DUF4384)